MGGGTSADYLIADPTPYLFHQQNYYQNEHQNNYDLIFGDPIYPQDVRKSGDAEILKNFEIVNQTYG